MIPILYSKNESDFTHNGIGFLKDTIKCTVTEERNGAYECTLQYPITGQWYNQISDGCIIKAKANETSEPQLFRIYKSSKPLKGVVTYSAEHISYDLNGIPVAGFSVQSVTPQTAIGKALQNAELPCPFEIISDISTLNSTSILTPCSVRAILGGQRGSVLDVWGGEYEFDNFTIKLHKYRGTDNSVKIAYGKNLTDLKQDTDITECYTHLLPYAVQTVDTEDGGRQENYIYLTEKIIPFSNSENIGHNKAYIMDFTSDFSEEEEITEETLRSKAEAYAETADHIKLKTNITISFVQLWQTEEYKSIAPLERVSLCDTVSVYFSQLGVTAKTKVIKTVYDSLKEKYESIELGDAKSNFADTINEQKAQTEEIKDNIKKEQAKATEEFKKAILTATNLITGHSGGYIVLNPAEKPQEILILDKPTLEEAVKVWRWNSGGLGYSTTGYNGEYALAITMDGSIVADFIKAGELNGNIIKAETIQANAISSDTFRIIFNTVSDYILFENGQLKIMDDQNKENVVLGINGIEIFNGDITVYSGEDRSSHKVLFLDSDGNISYAGYLGQPDTYTKAIVGNNAYNNPGLFVYQFEDEYKNSDGTYKPYIEFWRSANKYTYITGVNRLYINVDLIDETQFTALMCSDKGGNLYGAWNFGQDQCFSKNIGTTLGFVLERDGTRYGSFYLSTSNRPCFNSDTGADFNFCVSGNSKLTLKSSGGQMFGAWDFSQDQFFTHIIGSALGFVLEKNGVRYGSFYKNTSNEPTFNSDSGYYMNFAVSNNIVLKCYSGGGWLYGTWYGTSSQAIPSDENKKHDIEALPEKYSTLFDNLRPVRYKYNDGTSDRYHTGFISQEVEKALTSAELDSKEFAGFVKDSNGDYYLRYEEFIGLCVAEIQKLKRTNAALNEKISSLENKTSELEKKLNSLLGKTEA